MEPSREYFKPSKKVHATAYSRALKRVGKLAKVKLYSTMDEVELTQKRITLDTYYESVKTFGASLNEYDFVIKPRTLSHRKKNNESLTQEESGRWLRVAKVQALTEEVFGSQEKGLDWLHKKQKKFKGQRAIELIQTEAGAQLVEETLNQIDAGYFA